MKDVLILNRSDFKGYHNEELLANLDSCDDIKFGKSINFKTNTRFEGTGSRVMDAFNIFLRHLTRSTDRIIIN
tara:strand:+ start:207 stop:425 length:219 start_codon:yes stop_codon:yes gene_type:complete